MNFGQKLRLFSDIYFCMDITRGMVREDVLTTYFGSTWSCATNKIADKSAERGCQSKWWHKRMETRMYFLNRFYHPRFASGYDQNQLIITDVSKENKHRVVPKLMKIAPKWDKRNNRRKSISHFRKHWTRITGWLKGMPKVNDWYRKPEKWLKTEFSISKRWRIEQKVILLETIRTSDSND